MLEGIILRALTIFLLLIMILQSPISSTDDNQKTAVKALAHYAIQKAAPDGYLSDSLRAEIINELKSKGFKADEINIDFTSSRVERGQRITIVITVPRMPVYFINFGSLKTSTTHIGKATTISEYVE